MADFGICIPQEGLSFKTIREITSVSEKLGYSSIWLYDHLFAFPYPDRISFLECWTTLTALASKTSKIRIGSFVINNQFRYPSLLAKMVATLDVISNGRVEFGIGAGARGSGRAAGHKSLGYLPEYKAYGITYPEETAPRVEYLRESIQIMKKMWTEKNPSFKGTYFTIDHAICNPPPIQKPHPPILIGGVGEKFTLRAVAELADISNFPWDFSPLDCERKLDILKKHCRAVGRDFDEIKKSLAVGVVVGQNKKDVEEKVSSVRKDYQSWYMLNYPPYELRKSSLIGTPLECIKKIQAFIKSGISFFILSFPGRERVEGMQTFSEEILPNI